MSAPKGKQRSIHIKVKDFLQQWDKSSKKQRIVILDRFIEHFKAYINQNNIYQLDKELGEITPLFFTRIMSSFQMNHMKVNLIPSHIECVLIYLKSQHYKQYIERFINSGGIQLILHVLEHRKNHSGIGLQHKCLSIIKLVIKSNCNFKEIICMSGGIQLLLNMIVDKKNADHYNLLYCLYDILKQLCIRNNVYSPSIHQSIINYIQQNSNNYEAVKTLLKTLQSTLSFNDDIRIQSARNQNQNILIIDDAHKTEASENVATDVDQDVMNQNNMKTLMQLIELQNHQIVYQLQNLCNVVLRSSKAQIVLLQCLVDLINESNENMKIEYIRFIQKLMAGNIDKLTLDAKQILIKSELDVL